MRGNRSAALTEPLHPLELINRREVQKPLLKKLQVLLQRYFIVAGSRELPEHYLASTNVIYLSRPTALIPCENLEIGAGSESALTNAIPL